MPTKATSTIAIHIPSYSTNAFLRIIVRPVFFIICRYHVSRDLFSIVMRTRNYFPTNQKTISTSPTPGSFSLILFFKESTFKNTPFSYPIHQFTLVANEKSHFRPWNSFLAFLTVTEIFLFSFRSKNVFPDVELRLSSSYY